MYSVAWHLCLRPHTNSQYRDLRTPNLWRIIETLRGDFIGQGAYPLRASGQLWSFATPKTFRLCGRATGIFPLSHDGRRWLSTSQFRPRRNPVLPTGFSWCHLAFRWRYETPVGLVKIFDPTVRAADGPRCQDAAATEYLYNRGDRLESVPPKPVKP